MSLEGESYLVGVQLLTIYVLAAVIRMGNWVQNDTFRSAGDASYGTVLEIVFMYVLVLPCVYLTGFVFRSPFFVIFACCYIDEPIRLFLMQRHLFSAKWIKPVTPQGREAMKDFWAQRQKRKTSAE